MIPAFRATEIEETGDVTVYYTEGVIGYSVTIEWANILPDSVDFIEAAKAELIDFVSGHSGTLADQIAVAGYLSDVSNRRILSREAAEDLATAIGIWKDRTDVEADVRRRLGLPLRSCQLGLAPVIHADGGVWA
jgi:hypothetical protein